ncbi:RagB/SusD family nutrient uptake outer membrane protein [Reichenbachiella carrageenanivorans]|uniref:RagB/SusD family nutrient uptake outer membrane protein n=1 Tax=Reichenbachiella carrageenanivorans TaxID=2979869 RepID=A0ABY6D0Y5_9BACT|nr:RagB/SusD family nutrient uptake outer membrane protein [Reichenbachiella carrageenanivorans]UXX79832.1 RagB/SusD family nutrient uptake outer membrane protein [Reichenbachiella carrageenanivorans]
MKNFKNIIVLSLSILVTACSLDEEPPFPNNESVYATVEGVQTALDGTYQGLTAFNYMGNDFHYVTGGNSGFFVSGKGGEATSSDNVNLCSLRPLNSSTHLEGLWRTTYAAVSRANDMIQAIDTAAFSESDRLMVKDALGQAYFLRAYNYFNLVRLWGEVPLRLTPATDQDIHLSLSSASEGYDQIIADAELAASMMNGAAGLGYPKAFAAHMLLAKVYMVLATAPAELQDTTLDYWQLAYDHAIQVYGQYELVGDFAELWESEGGNTEESIFELQFNKINSSNFVKLFTASNAIAGPSWGRMKINAEVYDLHAATYASDPRIAETYKGSYVNRNPNSGGYGNTVANYPDNTARKKFNSGFPYLYKYYEKDTANVTDLSNQNFIIYRYADLLLMLSEISNELQNGEQLGYVTEVLARVGLTPQVGYSSGKDSFREAIMNEYRFELVGEGHDWFNNRRRGYQYFYDHVIDAHNNGPKFDPVVDVTLEDNEDIIMYLPLPAHEINTNQEIN